MSKKTMIYPLLGVFACTMLTGCMPKMTVEEMKAQMPERAAELDQLESFIGKWEFTGKASMSMLEESLETTGVSEYEWGGGQGFMIGRGAFTMHPFDEGYGVETWTYDSKAEIFRSTWTDSMGQVGVGVGEYDEEEGVWKMKAAGNGPWGKSTMKGWLKFIDDDTMEYEWAEYQWWQKTMEMSGMGKRVK